MFNKKYKEAINIIKERRQHYRNVINEENDKLVMYGDTLTKDEIRTIRKTRDWAGDCLVTLDLTLHQLYMGLGEPK